MVLAHPSRPGAFASPCFAGYRRSMPPAFLAPRSAWLALSGVALSLACSGRLPETAGASSRPAPASSTESASRGKGAFLQETATSRKPPTDSTARLIVAGPFGLREVALDGTPLRLLSTTPAQRPRLLANGNILFLTADGREMRIFEPDAGRERRLASLPDSFEGCPPPSRRRRCSSRS